MKLEHKHFIFWYDILYILYSVYEDRFHELMERSFLLHVDVRQDVDPGGTGRIPEQACALLKIKRYNYTLH